MWGINTSSWSERTRVRGLVQGQGLVQGLAVEPVRSGPQEVQEGVEVEVGVELGVELGVDRRCR